MAVQSTVSSAPFCMSFSSHKPRFTDFKSTMLSQEHPSLTKTHIFLGPKSKTRSRNRRNFTFAAPEAPVAETVTDEGSSDTSQTQPEAASVVVKQVERPRLVLKFVWMEKNIGLGLDQLVPGHGSVPLSPYFFWPRKDAWEELKATLESKPWISQKKMIILLNQATDIINLWQQSGGNLTS